MFCVCGAIPGGKGRVSVYVCALEGMVEGHLHHESVLSFFEEHMSTLEKVEDGCTHMPLLWG